MISVPKIADLSVPCFRGAIVILLNPGVFPILGLISLFFWLIFSSISFISDLSFLYCSISEFGLILDLRFKSKPGSLWFCFLRAREEDTYLTVCYLERVINGFGTRESLSLFFN